MQWQPIQDLPPNWPELASVELASLVTVWQEQANRLQSSGEFKPFMAKLRREIAIETGIIERLYTLDRGITSLLIEQGINEALIPHGATDRPIQQVVSLIQDQETAIEGLFDFVGGQRTLSNFYIKQLHQVLTQNQTDTEALVPATGQVIRVSLIRGDWKKHPNNPLRADNLLHEYCPPEQVASEMDRLIAWHQHHQTLAIPPEVEAAWLHHRFTQIHPFQDGNGRVARCLASLVFIQAGWFPLVLTRDDRAAYISASEQADLGNLSPLINLFAKSQKYAFIRSLGLSEQILSKTRQTQSVIAAIADKLHPTQHQTTSTQDRDQKVETFATLLLTLAYDRLETLATELYLALQTSLDNFPVLASSPKMAGSEALAYRYPIIETAKQLDYFANTRAYHQWTKLNLTLGSPTVILISFHGLGRESLGLLACSACAYHQDETVINDIQSLADSPFQFSYADEENSLTERFQAWLEAVLVAGLEYWNRSL